MAGKRYYGYQGHSGHRSGGASDGLFGWTVFIFLLIGFVFLCWMGSYYIFAHPEKAANYRLLMRMHKLEPPQRFEITVAPRGEFLKPGQLLEHFGSMTSSEIRRTNESLLRSFIRNYHQNRDLVPYAVGTYRVIGTLPLDGSSFCQPGLVALLQAVEQPEVLLEQLFTAEPANMKQLGAALAPGQEIKLEKPLDLSAIIHVERLEGNRIKLTTMPLLYGTYGAGRGNASFSLAPPAELNLDAAPPVLSKEDMAKLSGGKLARSPDQKGGRLSRIDEEATVPVSEPTAAKARTPQPKTALPSPTPVAEPNVARAIPVNAQPVLPAIPVGTPAHADIPAQPAVLPAVPVATPVPISTPAVAATPLPTSTPKPTPAATPYRLQTAATNAPSSLPAATPAVTMTNAPAAQGTNPPTAAPASQVWPVYAPGQMPRGRLMEPSEAQELASRGIGGERSYMKGRFSVTAAGNGRAVLRPQGALAGVPMGQSSKVRVIVEFPAGTVPPPEGSVLSRDNLRPFQITSVKKGDDGQINVYVREVTRGQ